MNKLLKITKALSDKNRVRILMLLDVKKELCLCQIIDMVSLSPPTVSKHVAVLIGAGLITKRKDGRWHYYSHRKKDVSPVVSSAIMWVRKSLAEDKSISDDEKKLKNVLKKDMEELCKRYKT